VYITFENIDIEYYKVSIGLEIVFRLQKEFGDDIVLNHMAFVAEYCVEGELTKHCRNFELFAVEYDMLRVAMSSNAQAKQVYGVSYWNNPPSKYITVDVVNYFDTVDTSLLNPVLEDGVLSVKYGDELFYRYNITDTPYSSLEELFYICETTCGGPTASVPKF
jgi:hypothetical protein